MNEEVIRPGLTRRIVSSLEGKRFTIGGNKDYLEKEYVLQYTPEIVDSVLNTLFQVIENEIEIGNTIRLNGYITIKPTYCNSRTARNVYENTEMEIPAQYKLKLKAGKKLTEACKRFNDKSL